MAKKTAGFIKLQIPAGKANPPLPAGPTLGQCGLSIMEFCKAFSAQTRDMEPGPPVSVVAITFANRSFAFVMESSPVIVLTKKAVSIQKGSTKPHTDKVGEITHAQTEETAKAKNVGLTAADLDAVVRAIAGSAHSVGITAEGL